MEQHEEMLSPEEQYAQLAPTLDADGFSLYAAAEEVTDARCCGIWKRYTLGPLPGRSSPARPMSGRFSVK